MAPFLYAGRGPPASVEAARIRKGRQAAQAGAQGQGGPGPAKDHQEIKQTRKAARRDLKK